LLDVSGREDCGEGGGECGQTRGRPQYRRLRINSPRRVEATRPSATGFYSARKTMR
jgi:hypothetical protein